MGLHHDPNGGHFQRGPGNTLPKIPRKTQKKQLPWTLLALTTGGGHHYRQENARNKASNGPEHATSAIWCWSPVEAIFFAQVAASSQPLSLNPFRTKVPIFCPPMPGKHGTWRNRPKKIEQHKKKYKIWSRLWPFSKGVFACQRCTKNHQEGKKPTQNAKEIHYLTKK